MWSQQKLYFVVAIMSIKIAAMENKCDYTIKEVAKAR